MLFIVIVDVLQQQKYENIHKLFLGRSNISYIDEFKIEIVSYIKIGLYIISECYFKHRGGLNRSPKLTVGRVCPAVQGAVPFSTQPVLQTTIPPCGVRARPLTQPCHTGHAST